MITLKDIYVFPVIKQAQLTEHSFDISWFPELSDLENTLTYSTLSTIVAEQKLQVNQIFYACEDGERTVEMYSVYYHGNPIMIVQQAGRGGEDFFRRFVTDATGYREMMDYLRHAFNKTTSDCFSPDSPFYIDDLLTIYGKDVSSQFGLEPEKKLEGFTVLFTGKRGNVDPGKLYIVFSEGNASEVPDFWRRGSRIFVTAAMLTPDELNNGFGFNLTKAEDRDTTFYWAERVSHPVVVEVPAI